MAGNLRTGRKIPVRIRRKGGTDEPVKKDFESSKLFENEIWQNLCFDRSLISHKKGISCEEEEGEPRGKAPCPINTCTSFRTFDLPSFRRKSPEFLKVVSF